ncbi:hypothetical protein ABZ863_13935 [Saccharomonospora sp. NPDC046836]|uniref:SHOCT-like domain-containing protein n=1 Tax=Saccharomonospora sp. NPDC046836 TaxID=3156921 RepID=UPI0033C5D7B9
MNEQRRQVLQMLADGKLAADEAERLIDALDRERPVSTPKGTTRPKYLRVVAVDTSGDSGPSRVNIRIPLQLLRAGVRLASLIPPEALVKINKALERSGTPIDLTELKPQNIGEFIEQLGEVDIDVDDADSRVQVFCE